MTSINPSSLLTSIKRKLGIWHFNLPLDDDELMEIIYEETLPLFSTYFPNIIPIVMNLVNSRLPNNPKSYRIDTSMFGDEVGIIGIQNVKFQDYSRGFYDPMICNNGYELFGEIQMAADYEGLMNMPIIFTFTPPNILNIDERIDIADNVIVELLCTHPRNMKTININYKEEFKKLAACDIKITLFGILKHMDKIDTTFGQIDLKIDDWSDAESERTQILENWNDKFLNNRTKKIYRV